MKRDQEEEEERREESVCLNKMMEGEKETKK